MGLANSKWIWPKFIVNVLIDFKSLDKLSFTFYSPNNSIGNVSASKTLS